MQANVAQQVEVRGCFAPRLTRSGPQRRILVHNAGYLDPKLLRGSFRTSGRQTRRHAAALTVRAVSAPEAPTSTSAIEKEFVITKDHKLKIIVEESTTDFQRVTVRTSLPGKLLLHWGVEGGQGYKGGWRLPGEGCRPEGTVVYKDRALQTPFKEESAHGHNVLILELRGGEVSDYLDFVIKDTSTNTWYDWNGDNFRVRLKPKAQVVSSNGTNGAVQEPQLRSMDVQDIPDLPQELCGIWAYIKWELAGCPNRSEADADAEYQQAITELKDLLRMGVPLDELWRVARGEGARYQDWIQTKSREATGIKVDAPPPQQQQQQPQQQEQQREEQRPAPQEPEIYVPDDLVGVVAYIMWEQAGKPDGADFGDAARKKLRKDIKSGKSVDAIRKELEAPPPPPPPAPKQQQQQQQQAPPQQEAPQQPVVIGRQLERSATIFRTPLAYIKSDRPLLSMEKKKDRGKPLTPLSDAAAADTNVVWQRTYNLGQERELLAAIFKEPNGECKLVLTTDIQEPVVLHWGVKKGSKADWLYPPASLIPEGSVKHEGGIAVENAFGDCEDADCEIEFLGAKVPLQRLVMHMPEGLDVSALTFVIRSEDSTMWWRDGGSNFSVPIPGAKADEQSHGDVLSQFSDPVARQIVDCEVNHSMWTLMHRCNKAADLVNEIVAGYYDDVAAETAMIYVWLRYSALRQLTWQRNYNTQPRILGAAQERLTQTVAHAYSVMGGEAQEWTRYMLTCVGRGGNAQAVRDEILNIMHRNRIPEKKDTWMEQWHQKLHNNTTPDDVIICEAYLAFLHENGNPDAYWRVLHLGGITRERMASFERPVNLEAEYFPDKRDALINDFNHYLGILKACHSGAELQSSAAAAGPFLPDDSKGNLGFVLANQGSHEILPLIQNAVDCRSKLARIMHDGNREILYLDLALESVVRTAAERGAGAFGMGAAPLVAPLLANLILSVGDNEELCYCLKAWEELPDWCKSGASLGQEDALRTLAVVDRIRRALATRSEAVMQRIQPIASSFGHAFGCEEWAVDLFAEEVVRSGPAFAVSLVLSSLEQPLRSAADLSSWQVISPGSVSGRLVIVDGLHEVQDKSYSEPTVLFARRITGEEEVPDGVVGLVGPDAPDVLAHLSVRARNMHVLFAACYEEEPLKQIEALAGKVVNMATTANGSVTWAQGDEALASPAAAENPLGERKAIKVKVPKWSGEWVLTMGDYGEGRVGAKSKNLERLRGQLPDSINLPASVTLPFGCFEEALKATPGNKKIGKELDELVQSVDLRNADQVLTRCRDLAMQVEIPQGVQDKLAAAMETANIRVPSTPARWEQAFTALKGVWASKFNERAYISMRKVGLNFMDIRMAVLVQRVVSAKYAYVIHTRNPATGDENEIYAELVIGLGEAIVSGMVPGSALAFVARKDDLDNPRVVLYPSKGEGMFVKDSLIFRSDSNGEDLEGYAGAGLYDSITMDPTVLKRVDYNEDRIMQDAEYRRQIMSRICKVGAAIEAALGSAQDVEGVVDPEDNITVVQTRPQM